MRSRKCHQVYYKLAFDVTEYGNVLDPWRHDAGHNQGGEGCVHSGYYTRFYPDVCARGYYWTGERHFLEEGKRLWHYGSRRTYRSKGLRCGPEEVYQFATSGADSKNETVLAVNRIFAEWAHPRDDAQAPKAITDLKITVAGEKATVSFTAPADAGGGKLARYQVKCSQLPILPYEEWDCARDLGGKRNWWRAVNLKGEPAPRAPGAKESFTVTGVPANAKYFAVRSFDDSNNRSAVSNLAGAGR
jgi:hypothetical protein